MGEDRRYGRDRDDRGGDRRDRDDRGGDRGGRDGGNGGRRFRRRRTGRKRPCKDCKYVDFKDIENLRKSCTANWKIQSRKRNGTCSHCQGLVKAAVKRARFMGLIPYVG